MIQSIKVREHTHTFIPADDLAFFTNTYYQVFRETWIEQMALTLALMIPGADPVMVTSIDSPFYRAAKDIWYYMKEDLQHTYWDIRTQPIYEDARIGIIFIRYADHRPEIKWYSKQ